MTQQKSEWIFDAEHYERLNRARAEAVAKIIPPLQSLLGLKTALDLGCGLGHFSSFLSELGLDVLGVDGREENVLESRRRYPQLKFEVADAQDPNLSSLGQFDLVFCYGLLYHLENPFATIRSISKMSRKLITVEGVVYPSPEPILVLLDENNCEDQGLNYVAYYPSEAALAKMLAKSGFPECYLPATAPDHPVYRPGRGGFRQRAILFASPSPLSLDSLSPWSAARSEFSPWAMAPLYPVPSAFSRLYSFFYRRMYGKGGTQRRK